MNCKHTTNKVKNGVNSNNNKWCGRCAVISVAATSANTRCKAWHWDSQ